MRLLIPKYSFNIILIASSLVLQTSVFYSQSTSCPLGDSLAASQDYLGAIDQFTKCYEQDTTDKSNLIALSLYLYLSGDYQLAKEYYHQLENIDEYRTEAIQKLASIYESQQNLPKAIKYNLALSKIYPRNPTYLRKLGNLYQQGNEKKQAFESFKSALFFNPRDVLAMQSLSEIYLTEDIPMLADSMVMIGLDIDSTHIGLSLLQARIKYKLRDYSNASAILYKLTYQTELNNYYNKLLGYSFMQVDSLDKAIFFLQKSLLNENDPEYALYYLALAHERKKEYEKALWFFEEAGKAGISDNMAQYHKGQARIYTHQGAFKSVIAQYEKSLEYEKYPSTYFFLGNAAEQYYSNKSKALNYYQKYVNTGGANDEYMILAKDRIKTIKEYKFMKGNQ